MQLGAPAFMGLILRQQSLAQWRGHGRLFAGVLTPLAAQHADRITLRIPGSIVPSFQRGDAEADWCAGDRMTPFAGGQLL